MKTFTWMMLFILSAVVLSSCEGEQGPPGLPGEDGLNAETGTIMEITGTFSAGNGYKLYYEFPNNLEIYSTDIVLIYILWEQTGEGVDVWRLLPQTRVFEDGILQYNFDYTYNDVQLFLEGTVDFASLSPADTDNQVFRIAVLPAVELKSKSVDINNLDSVMSSFLLSEKSIRTMSLKK